MNIEKDTRMYFDTYRVIKRNNTDIDDIMIMGIINTIEENLEEYGIEKYNGTGSPTDEIQYYLTKLSKKAFGINILETPYRDYPYKLLPFDDIKKRLIIEETINDMKTKKEINKFLEWYKVVNSGISEGFDYTIITDDQISDIISKNRNSIIIHRQNLYYVNYNPIIVWDNDGTIMIMDWVCLKNDIIREEMIDIYNDFESFYKEFCTPTLYEQLKKDYDLQENVICALMYEIIKFYNDYKDKIEIKGDDICIDDMLLIDMVWNEDPLFSHITITHYVSEIYNGKIKI